MNLANKSWKTTLFGILGLVGTGITVIAIPMLDNDPATVPNWGLFLTACATAFGLVAARDNNKTSSDVGAEPKKEG